MGQKGEVGVVANGAPEKAKDKEDGDLFRRDGLSSEGCEPDGWLPWGRGAALPFPSPSEPGIGRSETSARSTLGPGRSQPSVRSTPEVWVGPGWREDVSDVDTRALVPSRPVPSVPNRWDAWGGWLGVGRPLPSVIMGVG